MSASDTAKVAARYAVYVGEVRPVLPFAGLHPDRAHDVHLALDAAHDLGLGLDRSVCLRDVVEALERYGKRDLMDRPPRYPPAVYIERELGGKDA